MIVKKALALFISFFCFYSASAQLTVQSGYTAQQLAEILAGPGLTVTNATLIGAATAAGTFDGTNSNIGVNSGVILCTGDINIAVGPNGQSGAGANNGLPGTPELDAIAGVTTNDAVVLQFDFEVQTESITFNYVFGSEEYLEFVDAFNDVFAFWISGPGISGWENIALIPNTTVPVTINNINDQDYWQYYVDNGDGTTPGQNPTIQYDGFTTLLAATKDGLVPCETYTLRLAIADALDWVYDTGVFLEENSLVQGTVDAQTNTINADNVALEGCIMASFTFTIDTIKTTPTVINYGIGGTATNGVDYVFIDSTMTIPAGQTSATIIIDALADGIPETQEVIELYFMPAPCTPIDTVFLYIDDAEPINFSLSGTNLGCAGDSSGIINATITGGFPPYSITLNDQYTFDSVPITNLPADTYLVSITDIYGCDADLIVTGGIDSAGMTFLPDGDGNVYTTSIDITAFNPSATLTDINMLQSVCITMEHSFLNELEIKLIAPDSTEITLKQQPGGGSTNLGEPVPKQGSVDDSIPGVGYQYCFIVNPFYGTMVSESNNYTYTYIDTKGDQQSDKYLPAGSYQSYQPLSGLLGVPLNGLWTVWVQDHIPKDNGYIFSWTISLSADFPDSIVIITEPNAISMNDSITFATCGDTNGAIDVTVAGDFPPFTYSWNTGATTEDISNIGAGTYTLSATDSNGCTNTATFLVQNISSIVLSATVSNAACNGSSDGSIDLTVSGGVTPYTFNWDNGALTEDIFGLTAGDYTVNLTDSVGCISLETITVIEPDVVVINAVTLSNEKCGEEDGAIDIAVTGGMSPFTYNWSNGEATEDIDSLSAGDYSVTVTDSNGCIAIDTLTLINEVGNCVIYCYIEINNILITDEVCGNGSGAIDISVINGTQPFNYSWSNGEITEDISGLSADDYTVTVTGADGCEADDTITVNNNTGDLAITGTVVTNESCGNGQGGIDNTISGGTLPYSYLWSNGQTSEDATGLSADSYSCTITDANGCSMSMNADIVNDAGTLVQTWGNAMNELCGNGQGSVDITISGGAPPYTYLWTNGATTEDVLNLSAGTYSCNIIDFNGCQINTPTYTINNDAGTLDIYDIDIFNEICSNGTGSINLDISGGTTPYSFVWNTGATTEDLGGLSAGTYSCQVTDANSCSVNSGDIDLFNSPGTLMLDDIFVVDENCNNNQGYINITISGGAAPYTFAWSNGSTSEDISSLSEGTYSCVISDTNGCTINTEGNVINTPGTLVLDNVVITDEVCGNGQGAIDLMFSGGTVPITYSWSNGAITEDIFNLSAGTYTCLVTDSNGCSISSSAEVLNDAGTLSLDNTVVTNEMCGDAAGAIDITISGGIAPYGFNWDNGATTEDITGLSAGTYSCQVTDNNACIINIGPITINNSSGSLTILSTLVTNESCGNASGVIDLTISGGTVPYSYSWSTGATTEDISGLVAGTYTCQVTDAAGCSVNTVVDVLNDAGTLNLDNVAITDEVCGDNAGAIDLTNSGGTAPYTFTWSSGATTEDISGLSAGTYSCTINDANGCTINTDTFNVVNSSGTLSLDNVFVSNENCSDSTGYINITLSGGTAPYTFGWSNGETTEDVYDLTTSTYTCQITDNIGCTINLTANVLNDAGNLTVSDSLIANETCSNGQGAIDITVSGGNSPYSFYWSNGDTTEDISGISAGTYTLLVTDSGGCSTNHSATIINIGENFSVSGISVTNEICGNGQGAIDIAVTGGGPPYTYNWSTGATTEDISGLSTGNYSVTVTDTNACTTSADITVQNSSVNLIISNVTITDDYCAASIGAIDITVTGGTAPYTYSWSTGATTQDISGLLAGNYSVIVTDWNGCGASMSADVVGGSAGFAISNAVVTDEICGDSTGAIDITVVGGTTPYTFAWSNGATTEDISGLNAGIYGVTVTDALGCDTNTTLTVLDSSGTLAISSVSIIDDNCGDSTGTIDITITGGTAPYTYSWNNGAVTEDITGLNAGNYTVTVTDTNNCSTGTNADIVNIAAGYDVSSAVITDELCSDTTGAIDITVVGGAPPYTFLWSNGATTEDISGLNAGNFTATVTDSNGCNTDTTVTVQNNPGSIVIDSVNITDDYCGDGNGAIDIVVSGGTPPYYFNWSNGDTTEDISGLSAGNYSVIFSDTNNCITSTNADILNIAIGYEISDVTVSNDFCGDGNGYIDITVSAGTPPYTYLWSNGATTEDITGLSAGLYTVTVSDSYGCTKDSTATILNTASGYTVSSIIVTDEICGDGQGAIDVTVAGGASPYSYSWNTSPVQTTEDISGLSAGSYTCIINDNNGCDITAVVDVFNQTGSFSIDTLIITDENCGDGQGAIDVTHSGGVSPFTFAWSTGNVTEDISGLSSGNYTCQITDSNGCIINLSATVTNAAGSLILDSAIVTDENCGDGQGAVDITVSGGITPYTFAWSSGATTEDITGLNAGNYTCQIADASGCIIGISENVLNETGGFSLDTSIVTYEICGNGQGAINITVSGGASPYTFAWSTGAVTEDISGLSAGNYTVAITDNNGCIINDAVDVLNATGTFSLDNIIASDEYCTNGLGSIDITVSGGVLPYTFAWSNGATTEDIANLSAGNYTCVITDSTGCVINTGEDVLNQTLGYSVGPIVVTDEVCNDGQGSIDITVSGGFTPYIFTWSNGATTEDVSNISAGAYSCTITDSAGCILNAGGTVLNETAGFALVSAIVADEICSNGQGSVDVTVSGGVLPYTFAWSNGATTEDITGLSAGNFTVTINDSLGCNESTTVTVQNDPGNLTISNITITDEICGNGGGAVDITISGGFPSLTFLWNSGAVTEDVTGLSAGNYSVTVTDSNGCVANASVTVPNNPGTLTISNVGITDELCGNGAGAVDITISGGFPSFTFLWSNGAFTEDITGLNTGNYSVTVTDLNGCVANTSAIVQNSPGTLSIDNMDVTDGNCGFSVGVIDLTVSGGNTPYSFNWSNGEVTEDINGLDTGIYTVIVTDSNSCMVTDSATIIDTSGGPPQTSTITGLTNVNELTIENYSVSFNAGSVYYWTVTGGNQISGGLTNAIGIYWGNTGMGLIAVIEKNSAGCFGDTVYSTVNIGGVGVNEFETSSFNFQVYPNPSRGVFTLEIQDIKEIRGITVFNILGQAVYTVDSKQLALGSLNKARIQIDLSKNGRGIYNMQLLSKKGIINKKIIID